MRLDNLFNQVQFDSFENNYFLVYFLNLGHNRKFINELLFKNSSKMAIYNIKI